jgi:hypothetical protein
MTSAGSALISSAVRGHQRFEAVRFLRDHDGETLAATRPVNRILISMPSCRASWSNPARTVGGMAIACKP